MEEVEKEVLRRMKMARPAMLALMTGELDPGRDPMEYMVDAFVELEPSLGSRRDQVTGILVAVLCTFQRQRGEHVATCRFDKGDPRA